MTEKTIRRYCRAVGSYLPCARRQKRQLLRDLRQRLEEYRDEHPDETSPEERFGTPQQVEDECRRILDVCAPGGGFIFQPKSSLCLAKRENVEAMFRTVHEYGKY